MRLFVLALAVCSLAGCGGEPTGRTRVDASRPDPIDAGTSDPIDAAPPPPSDAPPADAPPLAPDTFVGTPPDGCPAEPQPDTLDYTVPPDPGPVVRYTVRPYYTVAPDGVTVRDAVTTGDVLMGGVWLVPEGDTMVADSNQKNAANRLCEWIDLPVWSIDDPTCAIHRTGIRNPFLFRARAEHLGELTLSATIDGVASNALAVRIVPAP